MRRFVTIYSKCKASVTKFQCSPKFSIFIRVVIEGHHLVENARDAGFKLLIQLVLFFCFNNAENCLCCCGFVIVKPNKGSFKIRGGALAYVLFEALKTGLFYFELFEVVALTVPLPENEYPPDHRRDTLRKYMAWQLTQLALSFDLFLDISEQS